MNKPIKRWAWVRDPRVFGRYFTMFYSEHSLHYRKVWWCVYEVTATEDCHTTGGALFYVDPMKVEPKLNLPKT